MDNAHGIGQHEVALLDACRQNLPGVIFPSFTVFGRRLWIGSLIFPIESPEWVVPLGFFSRSRVSLIHTSSCLASRCRSVGGKRNKAKITLGPGRSPTLATLRLPSKTGLLDQGQPRQTGCEAAIREFPKWEKLNYPVTNSYSMHKEDTPKGVFLWDPDHL